jgi:hypothetical protein
MNNVPWYRHLFHLHYLAHIIGRRAFIAFAAVTFIIVFLLAAIQIASRYALKQYVEDQLARVSWDISLYQSSDLPLAEQARMQIAKTDHIIETQNIFFLRTSVPSTTLAYIDGKPMRSPWLSLLSVTDIKLLPSDIRPEAGGAVLVLIGSKAQMGGAYLELQNKSRFELRVDKAHHGGQVFSVPLERTVRMERNELNRWFMDQTSSPTLVPELGVILVTAYDSKILTAFDAVSRGIKHHHDDGKPEQPAQEDIHAEVGDYFPDIIHLARVDRGALISGWDVEGSHGRLQQLGAIVRSAAQQVTFRIGIDNTSGVLLERMSKTARIVGLVSLLAALPLLWMTWVLLANLSALLLLNERRKFGLLRLRGVSGKSLGQTMQIVIGAGGLLGGLLGAALGTLLPILFYSGRVFSWDTMLKVQNPMLLLLCLIIGVALSLIVSRRLVSYAAHISPLEASGRIVASESAQAGVRFGIVQIFMLFAGSMKVIGWIIGWSLATAASPGWLQTIDRSLDFVAFPFFVYGATAFLASRPVMLAAILRPAARFFGGRLSEVSLQHMRTRPHRVSGLLLIVALMASLSLYPTVMTAVFDNKIERAARLQLGSPLQITLNTPDLVPAAMLAQNGLRERYALIREQSQRLVARLNDLKEVKSADYMVEGLVDGIYMPGHGFNSIPIYLVNDPGSYLKNFYFEQSLGASDTFSNLLHRLEDNQLLLSTALSNFWRRSVGSEMPVGHDIRGTMLTAQSAGTLHFLSGIPLAAVKDRESFVGTRIDYLNHLFNNRAYLVAAPGNKKLATLDVLIPRLVLTVVPEPGTDAAALKHAVLAALPVEPLEVRELHDEVLRMGSDMYIFLARENVQIYLLGGVLMALIGILAMAFSNYAEDRRTLGLLRIRGCGPREVLQFLSAGLSAPAVVGLIFGAMISLMVGYGITNLIWQLREIKTIMIYLRSHLAVSWQTALVSGFLLLIVFGVLVFFSHWVFKRTARESLADY